MPNDLHGEDLVRLKAGGPGDQPRGRGRRGLVHLGYGRQARERSVFANRAGEGLGSTCRSYRMP
jgi:hypothetical protein